MDELPEFEDHLAAFHIRSLPTDLIPIPETGGRVFSPAGEMAQVGLNWTIRFLVCLQFDPGNPAAARGNHVHNGRVEYFYLMSGLLRARFRSRDSKQYWTKTLQAGDFVTVQPGCAHAYQALSLSYAIEFSESRYDAEDTKTVSLLPLS